MCGKSIDKQINAKKRKYPREILPIAKIEALKNLGLDPPPLIRQTNK
jgi:hypothetical protein